MTNLVILVGRIARDPEGRTTQGGTDITSLSVVTDRPARKDEPHLKGLDRTKLPKFKWTKAEKKAEKKAAK